MENNHYRKFALMLALSFLIMYLVMYLNVASLDHVYLSLTRFYMTVLMVAPMALLMLGMMPHMYKDKKRNAFISLGSVAVFVLALVMLRSQTFVSDTQFMKAMIPHHSSAILTSSQADLRDPEVKQLADQIIQAQEKEIADMKKMLNRINP